MSDYERRIIIPKKLALAEHVHELKLDSLSLEFADTCTFDFRSCVFGAPFPMLLLADKIKGLVKRFRSCKYKLLANNNSFHSFADHVGFFRYIGWARGREPGEAWGSQNYIPIETFDISEVRRKAGMEPIGEIINEEAVRLTKVLCREDDGAVFDVMQYSIREILRNAAEHSKGSRVTIMGQYYSEIKVAEIVVIDDGIGIPSNLYDNEYIECEDSLQALKFAILPGCLAFH